MCVSLAMMLAACSVLDRPAGKRPITSSQASAESQGTSRLADAAGPSQVSLQEPLPRMDCGHALSQDEDLRRSVVEQLADQGDLYAALAQVDALPRRSASVGLLRAGILRQLDPSESERWYRALLGTCLSGRAEHGLGLLEASRGRYGDALVRMQVAARAYPADPRIRNDLGVLYLYLSNDARAAFELRTAHELAKDDLQPRFNLMLLALLQADVASWQDLSARWQPTAAVRGELLAACQRALPVRTSTVSRCPLDPRS